MHPLNVNVVWYCPSYMIHRLVHCHATTLVGLGLMCLKIYLLFYSALLAISPYYSLFYSDYSVHLFPHYKIISYYTVT